MKHSPRPLIEEHHHIQDLIEKQEVRTKDVNEHRHKQKLKQERDDLIKDSKLAEMKEFWCSDCKKDFVQVSVKQVEIDWSNSAQSIAFYKGKHSCGKWCIRLITDRHRDAYWFRSRKVHLDQGRHHNDVLQPFQTGFNLLYGKNNYASTRK